MLCYMNGLEFNQNRSNHQYALHILTMHFVSLVAFIPLSAHFKQLYAALTDKPAGREEPVCSSRLCKTPSSFNLFSFQLVTFHPEAQGTRPSRPDALSLHWGTNRPIGDSG